METEYAPLFRLIDRLSTQKSKNICFRQFPSDYFYSNKFIWKEK